MIPLSNISIGQEEFSNVNEALISGWISGSGVFVDRFESMLCQVTGRKYAIATGNGTQALEALMRAYVGVKRNAENEVIVPALTFVAPAAAAFTFGARLKFVDVLPDTGCINPLLVSDTITDKTRAIIAVNAIGHMCDFDPLEALGVPVIEDAAESHGAYYHSVEGDKAAGANGVASIFSFHANKTISTGEGGAILTDTAALADLCRAYVNHGMLTKRAYHHELVGSNYRMTNIHAAIGVAQAGRWSEFVRARNRIGAWYQKYLPDGLKTFPRAADYSLSSTWLVCVLHPDRDSALARLKNMKIDARALWRPTPSMQPYYEVDWESKYPVAAKIGSEGILLPTWVGLTEEQVEYICLGLS